MIGKRRASGQLLHLLAGAAWLLVACAPFGTLSPTDTAAPTHTAAPTYTPIPIPTKTPFPTATESITPLETHTAVATASGSVFVRTIVQNVNLRTNPGTLFPVSRVMPQGTRLQILGLSPGEEWVSVVNDEGINGWIRLPLLEEFPTEQFPVVEPGNVQQITGRVLDENGLPVSGIGYAIEQQNGSKALRTDAVTDTTGTFHAYLPQSVSGVWTVSYVSISCTSNMMDTNCNCLNTVCGTSYPVSASVNSPVNGPLIFVWK